ncbi:MAG: putative Ig domain-containing protein [Nitrosomonadales bacterium]|nr:putative Ig domain-containing protein [Nitrosomonadales bacterium]
MASFSPLTPSGGALPYTYSYTGTLPAGLNFSATTGVVSGTPTSTYATASLIFSVKDANNIVSNTTSTVLFTVGAASANIVATATTTPQNLTVGTAMASFSPLTPSGGTLPYTYSYIGTLPTGLSFNTATGAVTGTPAGTYATASLIFLVRDANNVVASTTSTVLFTVGAASANIVATATTTPQNLTVGTAMASFSPLVPSGGVLPYTYSYIGTLPTGLSFNAATGAVTGTPTAPYATASLIFSVKDANNVVASTTSTVLFTVGAASTNVVAIATTTAQNLTAGTAMASFLPLTPSGGVLPYTYSYTGTLPTGLSFSASTGAVTGTPAVAYAAANLVFSVKDANNVVASTTSTVSFSVVPAPVAATDLDAFNAGYAAYLAKDYAGAAVKFDAMILAYPNSTLLGSAYYYLGKSLYHLNDLSGAIAKFDMVLNHYPSNSFVDHALFWKGKSVQKQGKIQFAAGNLTGAATLFANARTIYLLVISGYPSTTLVPDCRYEIALTYFDEKRYAEALPLFQAVLTNYPAATIADGAQYHYARSIHALAHAAVAGYSFTQARTEYGKLMTGYPASMWVDHAQYQIGKTYYDETNYSTALVELNKVLTNYPASTVADGAQYYIARSMHALALTVPPPYTLQQARDEYGKMKNYPLSIFVDNAAFYAAFTYHDATQCTLELTALKAFVAAYPLSTFVASANTHIGDLALIPPVTHTACIP